MLIQLRGTNGSGKSTLARKLLGDYTVVPAEGSTHTFSVGAEFVAIGDYTKTNPGLDTVRSTDEQKALITQAYERWPNHHVIFEGVLASTVWSTWRDFGTALVGRAKFLMVFLNTEFEECVNRVLKRREESGKEPRVPSKLHFDKFKQITGNLPPKCEAEGINYCWAASTDAEYVKHRLGEM